MAREEPDAHILNFVLDAFFFFNELQISLLDLSNLNEVLDGIVLLDHCFDGFRRDSAIFEHEIIRVRFKFVHEFLWAI